MFNTFINKNIYDEVHVHQCHSSIQFFLPSFNVNNVHWAIRKINQKETSNHIPYRTEIYKILIYFLMFNLFRHFDGKWNKRSKNLITTKGSIGHVYILRLRLSRFLLFIPSKLSALFYFWIYRCQKRIGYARGYKTRKKWVKPLDWLASCRGSSFISDSGDRTDRIIWFSFCFSKEKSYNNHEKKHNKAEYMLLTSRWMWSKDQRP